MLGELGSLGGGVFCGVGVGSCQADSFPAGLCGGIAGASGSNLESFQ